MQIGYRYLLAARPGSTLRALLIALQKDTGQRGRRIEPGNLHLTFCTISETEMRDRFIPARVEAALSGLPLSSESLWLGRVRAGSHGAAVHSRGRKPELLALYRMIATALTARGLPPMHRKAGFRPHFTLGYDACNIAPFDILCEWIPEELLLIESVIGERTHNVLGRWPLMAPPQGSLPFEGQPASPPQLAAGGR